VVVAIDPVPEHLGHVRLLAEAVGRIADDGVHGVVGQSAQRAPVVTDDENGIAHDDSSLSNERLTVSDSSSPWSTVLAITSALSISMQRERIS
jgi:hypothetical protein